MTTEPISVDEAKRHLRLDDDDPGVSDVSRVITAARQYVEQFLNASVVVQTRTKICDAFPAGSGAIQLSYGPVLSVTSIAYIDSDGASQTVASWIQSEDVVTPAYSESWPVTRTQIGAVTITYSAGMMAGSPLTLDEKDIVSGILLVLGDLWENRESQFVGVSAGVNKTIDRLLWSYRRDLGI